MGSVRRRAEVVAAPQESLQETVAAVNKVETRPTVASRRQRVEVKPTVTIEEAVAATPGVNGEEEVKVVGGKTTFQSIGESTDVSYDGGGNAAQEIAELIRLVTQPGVMAALKFAIDLARNPPSVELDVSTEIITLEDDVKLLLLDAVEETAKAVEGELIDSDDVDEIIVTDEDIPQLKEDLDSANESALGVLKNRITTLREKVAETFKNAAPNFTKVESADLGDEFKGFDYFDRIHEANQLLLVLRKFHKEL